VIPGDFQRHEIRGLGQPGTARDYEIGMCEFIDRVSLHPPQADSEIHQIIPKESGYHPVEINQCRIFSRQGKDIKQNT